MFKLFWREENPDTHAGNIGKFQVSQNVNIFKDKILIVNN